MQKRIPLRQCLGCRTMKQKSEIVRFVKSPEGKISLDLTGKKPGRGAYVCLNINCIKRIIKSNALGRSLKAQVPEAVLTQLQEQLEKNEANNES